MTMQAERIELMPAPVAPTDWRVMTRVAACIIVFTFVFLGGWSAIAHIDSAVVADGTVAVESNRKTIQHLEGGIVGEILVRDGDVVQRGQTLMRLDPTRDAATDKGFRQQLAIASAQQARLTA
jgi:multidrug efflux pump subunit AcrA (membrane-fusion protein)